MKKNFTRVHVTIFALVIIIFISLTGNASENKVLNSGSFFASRGTDPLIDTSHRITLNVPVDFGRTLASGDVNGDGYKDLIAGTFSYSNERGRLYIFFGGAVMDSIPDVTLTGENQNDNFACSVSSGDVNNDGYDDVVVGAEEYNNTGRVYLFFGGSLMDNIPDLTYNIVGNNGFYGSKVDATGDINGDGYNDVITCAPYYALFKGYGYVYLGGAVVNNAIDAVITTPFYSNSSFGISICCAGDMNNDGYDDIAAGSQNGVVYFFYGSAVINNTLDEYFFGPGGSGTSLKKAGDMNNDGYDDLISSGSTSTSVVYTGGPGTPGQSVLNNSGNAVSSAGDLNYDGFSDIMIGYTGNTSNKGQVSFFLGSSTIDGNYDLRLEGKIVQGLYGYAVISAGDINGDDVNDLAVTELGTSRIYIYPGKSQNERKLDLSMFIEGFYRNSSGLMIPDTIRVYLRSSSSPFSIVDSSKGYLSDSGIAAVNFHQTPGGNYYIVVAHRNSIETWSSVPVDFSAHPVEYSFIPSDTKAYGNNQKHVDISPDRYAVYSADVIRNGSVDLADIISVYNSAAAFITGYVQTDVTGDNVTNLDDLTLTYNNSANFVNISRP